MEQTFQNENLNDQILEDQLRESYAKVVYSHKTHLKDMDYFNTWNNRFQSMQIILSVITTGTFISSFQGLPKSIEFLKDFIPISTSIAAFLLLILNSYLKNYNLSAIAQAHKEIASKLFSIRENYLSLLVDFKVKNLDINDVLDRRNNLNKDLAIVYVNEVPTSKKAYKSARRAILNDEELFFTEDEIDIILPESLRRNKTPNVKSLQKINMFTKIKDCLNIK